MANRKLYPAQRRRLVASLSFVLAIGLLGMGLQLGAEVFNLGKGQTFGASDQVQVDASVSVTQINITTRPANRVPATNNWEHIYDLTLKNCGSGTVFSTSSGNTADAAGNSSVAVPSTAGLNGTKRVEIRGESHLNKNLGCQSFPTATTSLSFTGTSQLLIPGEVSVVYDNYINSLDLSRLLAEMGGSTAKYDLNRDGIVNQLDINILVNSLYVQGD